MRGRKGFTLIELLVVIAIIAILAAILFPVFAKARKSAQTANCQSNMNQIGKAIKTYLSDWDDTFPTNRLNGSTTTYPTYEVPLSPVGMDADGKPYKGWFGTSWVEGLYNYTEPVTSKDDASSMWKCQAATMTQYARTGTTARDSAAVTYVFNYNLLEQPESVVRHAANLMLVRETDLLVCSTARGGNYNGSTVTPVSGATPTPTSPFLFTVDAYMSGAPVNPRNNKLHATGSNILFADGHVKLISAGVQPNAPIWDATNGVWTNPGGTVHVTP